MDLNHPNSLISLRWAQMAEMGRQKNTVITDRLYECTGYRKFPKYSDTQNICCNNPKRLTRWRFLRVMHPKDAGGIANSVDPDQTAPRSSLIWVFTVCPDLSVQKLRKITVPES